MRGNHFLLLAKYKIFQVVVSTETHLGHCLTLFTKNNEKTTYLKFHGKKIMKFLIFVIL